MRKEKKEYIYYSVKDLSDFLDKKKKELGHWYEPTMDDYRMLSEKRAKRDREKAMKGQTHH
jgi:hypothetical protein